MALEPRLRVLVCDDEQENVDHWVDELKKLLHDSADVEQLAADDLQEAIAGLEQRQRQARSGDASGPLTQATDAARCIDQADILIVDYDLLDLGSRNGGRSLAETGERVAYLARCYSQCGFIVALNQYFRSPTFDLTLGNELTSFADLNVSAHDLLNPGLWGQQEGTGFRPWYWPSLLDAARRHTERVEWVSENLDASVLGALGLEQESDFRSLGRARLEFLGTSSELRDVTFGDWVRSEQGLRRKDDLWQEPLTAARIAAARLFKWADRSILPAQDIWVDAPHLALRFPSLLQGDPDSVEAWRATTGVGAYVSDGLVALPAAIAAAPARWRSRPAYNWRLLAEENSIAEVADPWSSPTRPFVFCEDTSSFVDFDDGSTFAAEVPGPWTTRYVTELDEVAYVPRIRLIS